MRKNYFSNRSMRGAGTQAILMKSGTLPHFINLDHGFSFYIQSPYGCIKPDFDGSLSGFFEPSPTPEERDIAQIEGWILGVK
jgi:hypothetical protein